MNNERKKDEMNIAMVKFLSLQFKKQTENIQAQYYLNSSLILSRFYQTLTKLLCDAKNYQQQQKKQPAQYLCFSFLRSSIYTKNYDFCITIYDNTFYLDKTVTYEYWKPDFIMNYFDQDVEMLLSQLRKNYGGIRNNEIEEIRKNYWYSYLWIVKKFLADQAEDMFTFIDKEGVVLDKDFVILFGGFMEPMIELKAMNNKLGD